MWIPFAVGIVILIFSFVLNRYFLKPIQNLVNYTNMIKNKVHLKPDWRENFYWLIQEPLTSWFQWYITLISQKDKSQSYSSPKIEFGSRNRHKTRPNFYFWGAVTMRYFILRYKCDTSLNSGSQGLFNELIKIFTPVWL